MFQHTMLLQLSNYLDSPPPPPHLLPWLSTNHILLHQIAQRLHPSFFQKICNDNITLSALYSRVEYCMLIAWEFNHRDILLKGRYATAPHLFFYVHCATFHSMEILLHICWLYGLSMESLWHTVITIPRAYRAAQVRHMLTRHVCN